MKRMSLWRDTAGSSAVELGMTAPFFFALLFGLIEGALVLWTQLGLQHATAMAARCASIDVSTCKDSGTVQSYAVQQTFGVNPPASTFSFTTPSCGNQVSATYQYNFVTTSFGTPSLTLTARSCFPK
jgi:Flp pilus assembly protein TadG